MTAMKMLVDSSLNCIDGVALVDLATDDRVTGAQSSAETRYILTFGRRDVSSRMTGISETELPLPLRAKDT
jgi:hypothetical protein